MWKSKQIKNSYLLNIKNKSSTFFLNSSRKILIKKIIPALSVIILILSVFLPVKAEENINESVAKEGYLIFGGRLIEPPYKVVFKVEGLRSAVEINGITIYEHIEKTEEEKIKEKRANAKNNLRVKYFNLRRDKKYSEEQAKMEIENEIMKEKDIGSISTIKLARKNSRIQFKEGDELDLELDKPMNEYEFELSILLNYSLWHKEYGEEKAFDLLKEYLEEEKNKDGILEDYKFEADEIFGEVNENDHLKLKYKGKNWGNTKYVPWLKGGSVSHWDPNQKQLPWYTVTKHEYEDLLKYLGPSILVIMPSSGGKSTEHDPKEKIEALKALNKENLSKEEKRKKIDEILNTVHGNEINEILDNFWEQK